jgi:hypothetical protein
LNKRIVALWLLGCVAMSVPGLGADVPAGVRGVWSSHGSAWDWLDDFDGPNAVILPGGTNTALPGPGQEKVFGTGRVEIIDHVARLKGSAEKISYAPCALSPVGPKSEVPAHTPGKAIVAYLGFADSALSDSNAQHSVGWISSNFVHSHVTAQIGLGIGDGRASPRSLSVLQARNDGTPEGGGIIFHNVLRSGDCLGAAIAMTETGYTVYIQGAFAEQWGCILGSNNWFPIFTTTNKPAGGMTGLAVSRHGVPLYLSRFGQMTQFRNDADIHLADCRTTTKRTLHNTSLCPDAAGGLWLGWHASTQEVGADMDLMVTRRAPDGAWSSKYVVIPADEDESKRRHFGSVSVVNGQVWFIYVRSVDQWKTTTLHYVVLTADAANNITWDAEHTLVTPPSDGIISSHAYTLPSGRIILPAYGEVVDGCFFLYSDNKGATWKQTARMRGFGELTLAREPSGQLVAFARPSGPNYVLRLTSPDDGATWSEPQPTTIWNPSCKFQARDLPDGNVLLVGNEFQGSFDYTKRPKVTAWILGDNAKVLRKLPVADYGPTAYNRQRLNYPDAVLVGNRLTVSWAHQGQISALWVVGANVDDWVRNTLNKESAERRLRAVLTRDNTLFSRPAVLPPKESAAAGVIQSGPDGHLYWHNGSDWRQLDN